MSRAAESIAGLTKTQRATNDEGFANLIELAVHLLSERPRNAATTFAVRCVVREASLKAAKKGKTRVHFISSAALDKRRSGETGDTIREHMVPLALAVEVTKRERAPNVEELAAIVEGCQFVAVITKAEDARLRDAGLVRQMPEGWDGHDKFSRYKHVGIELHPCPLDIRK